MWGLRFKDIALLGATSLAVISTGDARAQSASDISRQVVNSTVQSILQSIRDQIQRRQYPLAPTGSLMRFSSEGAPSADYVNDAFGALAYAKAPMYTKAPPAPPPPPPLIWGLTGTGAVDTQHSTVGGIGTTADTQTGVGSFDVTKIGIFTTSDALSLLVNGSDSFTRSAGQHVTTPGVGTAITYVNGGFSIDFIFGAAFSHAVASTLGIDTVIDSTSYSYSGDLNYKFDLPNAWWFEPTVGFTVTDTFFNSGGQAGETTLVQGGARLGTEIAYTNGVRVQPIFTGLAYSNVAETPGGPAGMTGAAAIPGILGIPGIPGVPGTGGAATDKGQVWGKGAAKLNVVWNQNFSTFIEGNVRGTDGALNALGYGGLLGLRLTW